MKILNIIEIVKKNAVINIFTTLLFTVKYLYLRSSIGFFVNFPFKIIYHEFKSLQHQKSKKGRFYSCS